MLFAKIAEINVTLYFIVGDRAIKEGAGEMGEEIKMEKFAGCFWPFFGGLAESFYETTIIRPRRVFIFTCLNII